MAGYVSSTRVLLTERTTYKSGYASNSDDVIDLVVGPADIDLPNVTVALIPAGTTPHRVTAHLIINVVENTHVANPNGVNGNKFVVIKRAAQVWGDAINAILIPTGTWTLAVAARESGRVLLGNIDISATVNANGVYNLRFEDMEVLANNLRLNDVQVVLEFEWRP